MKQFQVLIVGMGPVGLTAANLLGQAGIRTRIIEKDSELSGVPKALFIDDEFFRLLNAVGLNAAISAHTIYPVDFDYYSPLGFRVGHVVGRITEHNFPNRAATYQPEFERILAGNLKRFPSVDLAFGEELTGFSENADHVTAQVLTGSGEVAYNVDYILAADGARSVCRNLLGIDFEQVVKYGDRHVVIDVANDQDDRKIGFTYLGWRRNYMSLPMPGGRRRFEFSIADGEEDADILKDDTLERLFKPYREFRRLDVIRKVAYSFRARLAKRMSQGRVFLLGDAAHIMPVFGSQGMNSGARDANNIAWKLAAVLRGKAHASILDTYHEERYRHAAQSIRIAVANGKLQAVRTPPVAILRDLALGVVNLIPPLRRYIREMRYIPRPVVQSRLVFGDVSSATYAGRLLPNPAVQNDVGNATLLDQVLGSGFVLVGVQVDVPLPVTVRDLAGRIQAPIVVLRAAAPRSDVVGATEFTVTDHRFDEVFRLHAGHWLIVRPDRVVAAVSSSASVADDLVRFVREMQGETE
jgi:3-(3-hydroxy-phenyl)propionate hydroxylase